MFAQPFDCWCGAGEEKCCGRIEGAEKMDDAVLRRYYLNGHIEELLAERKEGGGKDGGNEGTESNPSAAS